VALATAFLGLGRGHAQEEPAAAPVVVMKEFAVPDDQFDQMVFQQDRNAAGARKRLDALLTLQVEDIDRACQVTGAQRQKLQLAGRGDIKRFFNRCDEVRQRFQLVRHDQHKVQEVWQEVGPLQRTLQSGLFHDGSLLHKSLRGTLTAEQLARYDAAARERRAFRHRATVELAVTVLEQGMPLLDAQRREVIALLTREMKPLRKSGQYEFYAVMYQLGRLPEGKLRALFGDARWKVMSRQLDQFRGLEPFLKQNGLWPDGDDGADDARPAPKN
jgi:hypothetical protein